MLKLFFRVASPPSRTVQVGWLLKSQTSGFIYDAPQKIAHESTPARHAKAVDYCPAVIDHEARLHEIRCPIDVRLRFDYDPKTNQPRLANAAGEQSSIRPKHLSQLVTIVGRPEWRHPDRPILQIATPYVFLADEPVYMMQLPPFCHYRSPPLPGLLIGGRLPIHVWPRPMMWAFEWFDTKQELVLRRGEPWFYVRFETDDPSRRVRLIEAEYTDALKEYVEGLSGVTNYVGQTFSLFSTARERRPKTLLVPKQR